MNDPRGVRFDGPLAVYADGLRDALAERGYTPGSAALQLQLAAQLSRWMRARELGISGLTAGCVREFVDERRARGLKCHISPRALGWLTDYLGGLGVLPAPAPAEILPAEALLERYRQYLLRERGLAAGTVVYYLYVARRFLAVTWHR
jgi:hypothetical protein